MSDEISRRCNGKQQRRRRGGGRVQLPDWVINEIKRRYIIALTWVTKNEVTFVEGISERRRKSEPFVFIRLFRIRGPISIWDGWTEEGREREVLNEEARVAASCQKIK